jgi:transposase
MRVIGMDVHRSFAQVAILEDGEIKHQLRIDLIRHRVLEFAKTLDQDDEVVVEATGNSAAVERLLRPYVKRVAIANPRLVRAIAYARVKTDKIDAAILARLYAAGFLPEVWAADEETLFRRRQTAERMGVLEQSVRLKGRIHAILHANLIPKYRGTCLARRDESGWTICRCRRTNGPFWCDSSLSWNGLRPSSASSTSPLPSRRSRIRGRCA